MVLETSGPNVISASFDGTWQKRYGFNSLLGVVFIISVESGEVLGYEVRSKFCFECKGREHWEKAVTVIKVGIFQIKRMQY